MSPYEIDILLHYHTTPGDHPDIVRNPPIWKGVIGGFKLCGLLEDDPRKEQCYRMTERGNFYVVEGLCNVPLPKQIWSIPWHTDDAGGAGK